MARLTPRRRESGPAVRIPRLTARMLMLEIPKWLSGMKIWNTEKFILEGGEEEGTFTLSSRQKTLFSEIVEVKGCIDISRMIVICITNNRTGWPSQHPNSTYHGASGFDRVRMSRALEGGDMKRA
ncbi:hypothetical protein [Benzoatithermus flavus]|uniref:Uncharacterized protein n=1 Tax=Benzoatithermus flavus TaxID=3108223 RepID=A0ABU8XNX8_9PROT